MTANTRNGGNACLTIARSAGKKRHIESTYTLQWLGKRSHRSQRPVLATCSYCGSPIRWVWNSRGGWAPPLEPYPDRLGNIVLDDEDRTGGDVAPDLSIRFRRHFCEQYDRGAGR